MHPGGRDGNFRAMRFAWNADKSAANLGKHGVTFEEASTAIADPLATTGADPEHSKEAFRWVTFGRSSRGRLLAVMHTEESDTIRIISARVATRRERTLYEED